MPRTAMAGAVVLLLALIDRRATPGPPPSAPTAFALRAAGPSLVLGVNARIESIDPETGNLVGSIAPIDIPGFTWRRFLRRGRFLLAEGETEWMTAPVWHSMRGLVLLDDTGRLRWSETHAITNRASHAVFLDVEGNVAFDSIDKSLLIKPDGTRLELRAPPAGPVQHGRWDVLPLRSLCSEKVERWDGGKWRSRSRCAALGHHREAPSEAGARGAPDRSRSGRRRASGGGLRAGGHGGAPAPADDLSEGTPVGATDDVAATPDPRMHTLGGRLDTASGVDGVLDRRGGARIPPSHSAANRPIGNAPCASGAR